MKKIPFNVSARTARLIGRENVSSAEGALIELVKNSYDADAKFCIVYFDDHFSELPLTVTEDELDELFNIICDDRIRDCYCADLFSDRLVFSDTIYNKIFKKEERSEIDLALMRSVDVHVMDNGDGMLESTIETSWMTIGTDNKNFNFVSDKSGRVKSGAKGIGRFALDRLGESCRLLTKTEEIGDTLLWKVDWSDFDLQGVTIDEVNAELGAVSTSLKDNIELILGDQLLNALKAYQYSYSFDRGTHVSISGLRDFWKRDHISQIFQELESLAPPTEAGEFSIYVFSRRYPEAFGKVEHSVCDDYDYKLSAAMDEDGDISFEIIRKEIDSNRISETLLSREFFQRKGFSRSQLTGEPFKYSKTLSELLPGLSEHDEKIHEAIGKFDFTLYFLKQQSDRDDVETFIHRKFDSSARKKWLANNSGIRIFRDNFRVRPYGEIGKTSWDWLELGRKKAEDPSALRSGRWKVPPHNVSGIIRISRIDNVGLQDKSSREGIQENNTFSLFKSIIGALIKEFELDKGELYREIYRDSLLRKNTPTDEDLDSVQEKDAVQLAHKIFEEIKSERKTTKDDSSKLALALLKEKARSRETDDRLEEMKKENSLLRVFASSGITIASFTHELDSLNAKLGGRFDQLEILIRGYVEMDASSRLDLVSHKDPFVRISMLRRDDERVKNWIKYSLRSIRKDKRKRTRINIKSYLENLRDEWNSTLIERQVSLNVSVSAPDIILKAYEIDLDCIFNNLIINSADAFKRNGFFGERVINVFASETDKVVAIDYRDSGPGLSQSIQNPNDIFKAAFTTKVNNLGEDIGTGLGMWLVQKTLDEYNGKAHLKLGSGFSINMEIEK